MSKLEFNYNVLNAHLSTAWLNKANELCSSYKLWDYLNQYWNLSDAYSHISTCNVKWKLNRCPHSLLHILLRALPYYSPIREVIISEGFSNSDVVNAYSVDESCNDYLPIKLHLYEKVNIWVDGTKQHLKEYLNELKWDVNKGTFITIDDLGYPNEKLISDYFICIDENKMISICPISHLASEISDDYSDWLDSNPF